MEFYVNEKVDLGLRIKSAEKVFNSIVEHTQSILEDKPEMSFSELMESDYGMIVDACTNEILRKLGIILGCQEAYDICLECITDASEGYECFFGDMCVALIDGR